MQKKNKSQAPQTAEKVNHKVIARHSNVKPNERLSISLIKHAVLTSLNIQGVDIPCEVSVLITDERSIREINKEFRGINKPTDVLSFPMQELTPMQSLTLDGWEQIEPKTIDPETGLLPLGEIVISACATAKQALELGHSRDVETAYLIVHSVLHLLGYDHLDEGENKEKMRECENDIMRELGFE